MLFVVVDDAVCFLISLGSVVVVVVTEFYLVFLALLTVHDWYCAYGYRVVPSFILMAEFVFNSALGGSSLSLRFVTGFYLVFLRSFSILQIPRLQLYRVLPSNETVYYFSFSGFQGVTELYLVSVSCSPCPQSGLTGFCLVVFFNLGTLTT